MNAPIIEWSTQYEVGVRFMDGQHRQMLDLVNRVIESAHQGRELEDLVAILRDLVRVTEHHFHAEETRMDEFGADAEAHRKQHRDLIESLRFFTDRLDANKVGMCSVFLRDWLLRHIESTDRPFATFLHERGVS